MIALGKENLFTGSARSRCRATATVSLLATAKHNDLDRAAWLKDTLERCPSWPNSRIDEGLPLARTEHKGWAAGPVRSKHQPLWRHGPVKYHGQRPSCMARMPTDGWQFRPRKIFSTLDFG